jgi:hypothetical protein
MDMRPTLLGYQGRYPCLFSLISPDAFIRISRRTRVTNIEYSAPISITQFDSFKHTVPI